MQPLLQVFAMFPSCFNTKQPLQSTEANQGYINLRKTRAATFRTLCVKQCKINQGIHGWSMQEVSNQAKSMTI